MALSAGTSLGSYEIIAPLGAGGMGEVYRARDTRLKRDVALKVLPDAFAVDNDRLARFRREAQVLAALSHPNIAAIHGLEDAGGRLALVLELVEGPTLADRLMQGPIPLEEALPIARQIAEALEAAHDVGIVHRDLKPANVKVRADGAVKVLRIVFAASASSGLSVVSASGGTPDPLTELDVSNGETNHRWPIVLPDGSGVLFAVQRRSRTELDIEGVSFHSKSRTPVRPGGFPVQILDTGHLVYAAINGDMFAAPFDQLRMALTGPSVPLPERPGYTEVPGFTSPALSPGGTMVSVLLREPARELVVISPDGARRKLDVPARNYRQIRISPNGQRIAVTTLTGISEWDIWTMNTAGGPLRRVTVSSFNIWPLWDSENTLLYSAFEDGTWRVLSRNVERNEPARVLLSGQPQEPSVLGRLTDRSLVYTLILPQQNAFVGADGQQPRAIALPEPGQFERTLFGFSPDGRWIAYTSEASGQREAFVSAVPDGVTSQVSQDGGDSPVWARAGRELYFRRPLRGAPDEIVSVTINDDGSIGPPTVVARGDYVDGWYTFDVFPDGSLLMMQNVGASSPSLEVVVNWPTMRGLATIR